MRSLSYTYGLKQLLTTPTRITKESKTLIDIICSSVLGNVHSAKVIPAGLSDHDLIGCVRKLHGIKHPSKTVTCRNFSNYNPNKFCNDLKSFDFSSIYSSSCVHQAWSHLKFILHKLIDKHAPFITKKMKGRLCLWLTADLKKEMNERDKLLRRARNSNNEILWSMYKRQRNRVSDLVKKCKSKYYRNLLNESAKSPDVSFFFLGGGGH